MFLRPQLFLPLVVDIDLVLCFSNKDGRRGGFEHDAVHLDSNDVYLLC